MRNLFSIMILGSSVLFAACSSNNTTTEAPATEVNAGWSSSQVVPVQAPQVKVAQGILEGTVESGIKVFRGIPFAAPPVGDLRWKAPQPVAAWEGVRPAKEFGDDPVQGNPFGDMGFNAKQKSEDCLYLNIWTPTKNYNEGLPIVIYFNGGGLYAGSGSEPRYAGESMARHGIISITANYREGLFGFIAHPELSKESTYGGSGNYGFMDQAAAIKWVYDNIAAFGGDPKQITIVGESAGSMSVSALLASPLTEGLISKAMASSGSVCTGTIKTLAEAEQAGVEQLKAMGVSTIAEARAMSAEDILKFQANAVPVYNIDGYFFTKQPSETYANGEQHKVPLLVGRNSMEASPLMFLQGKPATIENIKPMFVQVFGDNADKALEMYGMKTDADVLGKPGADFASDMFIAYSTWKFGYMHAQTSGQPVYRYYFSKPRPAMAVKGLVAELAGGVSKADSKKAAQPAAPANMFIGAVHSADIEYAMGTLPTNRVYDWQPEDFEVSAQFLEYYANFIKTGDPNGLGLADWHPINNQENPSQLILDVNCEEVVDPAFEARNKFLMDYLH